MSTKQQAQILSYSDVGSAMAALAEASGLESGNRAAEAHQRLAPIVVEAMSIIGQSPKALQELLVAARGLSWVERTSPEVLFENSNASFGHGLGQVIFGETMPALVSTIASNEGLTESNAGVLLEVIAAVTIGVMAGLPDNRLTAEGLAFTLAANGSTSSADQTALPPTDAEADSETDAVTAPAVAAVGAAPVSQPTTRSSNPPIEAESKSKVPMLAGAAVALLAVVGIGFVVFGGGSGEAVAEPEIVALDVETSATTIVESATTVIDTVDPEDGAPSADEGEIAPVNIASEDVVSLSVPMLDITDPERGASGVLNFDLNTVTGEVCYSVESINIDGPYRSHIHVGGYGVQGGIVVDLGPLESGEVGCVENLPIDTKAILDDRANHYAELHDVSEEFTIRGQLSETIDGDIVSLSVPMVNDVGLSDDASGVLNFDFNTTTGEVCYSVESINIDGPYRSHIHVGDAGVQGGIVVDLGPLDSGDVGCVENLAVDTNAILANKSGHYAELHDVSEEFTIRGQLSETVVVDDDFDVASQVDADGGGASIVLEGGTVFLEGAVPDQATADELFGSLSGLAAVTPVINNLTIDPDAPLPSGRVVIADAVFFDVASDEIKSIDEVTLEAITALALSRENWVLTVVGHTDDRGSDVDNLELSLRRASSLRDLLAAQGVPDENLRIRGAGETAPVGDNRTEAGRAENRRIEFEFTPSS